MPASTWPVIRWIAAITSSVASRRARPDGTPSKRPVKSIGSPNSTVIGTIRGRLEPTGWTFWVPGQPDGHDGYAGGQREVGDAGAAAVEAAVARPGALGVDPERLAAAEHVEGDVEAGDRGLGVVAVDRQHPEPLEPDPGREPLEAGAGEVVGLGEEDDLARHHARDHHRVDEAEVVAGQDHPAGPGHVLEAAHRRAARSP